MKVPELRSQFRLLTKDYSNLNNEEVVAFLKQGDAEVFRAAGGMQNLDIRRALSSVFTDTITPSRNVIVVPREVVEPPLVYVDDMLCHIISVADGQQIADNPVYLPAASVDRRTITVYAKPDAFTPGSDYTSKTKTVTVVYMRQPDTIRYYGGLTISVSDDTKYGKGSGGLRLAKVLDPAQMPYVSANEIVGGYVSVQIDGSTRADYRIEEHVAGRIAELYVSDNPDYVPVVDRDYITPRSRGEGYAGEIHKSSDLPESMHTQVAIVAAQLSMPKEAKK